MVGVEQGIILAIVLSLLLHVRRHYEPVDVVLAWDEHHHVHSLPPGPGVTSEPGLVVYRFGAGIFYANAARLFDEVLELAGGKSPPRWFVLDAPSIDDIDFTGGKTLVEIAKELQELGVVFAVADVREQRPPAARALRRDGHHRRRADLRHRRGRTRGVPRRESRAARRLTGRPRAAQSRPSPHTPVNESPGSSTIRSSPVRNAFGGQVMGSTARLRRSTSGQRIAREQHQPAVGLVDPQHEPGVAVGPHELDAGHTVRVPLEIGECVVELRRPDRPRPPEVVLRVRRPALGRSECRARRSAAPFVPGARRTTRSIVAVPTVRYGWAPLPNGHGPTPTFVAVVCTRRPAGESEYSIESSSENG